jgi:CRISPR-associated endonuclease Cas2
VGALLVSYDIADDGRRRRVVKALARFGRRVQYSVFLLHRGTPEEVERTMLPLLVTTEDDVRIQPLCAACEGKGVLLGRAERTRAYERFRVV